MKKLTLTLLGALHLTAPAFADNVHYLREEIPTPEGAVLELGSIALLPDQKVAVASRRGDVWICSGAYGDDLSKVTWQKFAEGLHEPFGMFWRDGELIATQRTEITAMRDVDGDGRADVFRTLNDGWGVNGDYHEYAFSSDPDKEGNIWTVLCLSGSVNSGSLFRGWCMRTTPDGEQIPTAYGIRSPGGIGFNAEGDAFYCDNQGFWNGSSSLKWLKPGSFQGNPKGNRWFSHQDTLKGEVVNPENPKEGSRIEIERLRIPDFIPPAVVIPHIRVGRSPTTVFPDLTEGKFGPYAGQTFVGEQNTSEVHRVMLEKVNGIYQGAIVHFLDGFRSGIVPAKLADDGTLFVGGTARGWGSKGGKPWTFERVRWKGTTGFEMHDIKIQPDGFRITFTKPATKESVEDFANYALEAWTYKYFEGYGSPELDKVTPKVTGATLSADGLTLDLTLDKIIKGHVHLLDLKGIVAQEGGNLEHPQAYYTVNEIPAAE